MMARLTNPLANRAVPIPYPLPVTSLGTLTPRQILFGYFLNVRM